MLLPLVGCATHGVAHVAPDESRPHISWEIRTGGVYGDADFVCGSSEPQKPCVLPASTEKDRALAVVHLFVHAAEQPTSYVGFMRAPFFEGELDQKLGEVSATVPPGSRPIGTTVVGRVTSKPGNYTVTISADAMQPNAPTPVRIAQELPLVVKSSTMPASAAARR